MENQADLIGERRAAAGAIGGELALMQLDEVFGLAAGAVEDLVDVLGRAGCEVGDDEADVEALCRGSMRAHARRGDVPVDVEIGGQALLTLGR